LKKPQDAEINIIMEGRGENARSRSEEETTSSTSSGSSILSLGLGSFLPRSFFRNFF